MTISTSSRSRSTAPASRSAYSSAATGSCTEHGPTTTSSRSSAPSSTSAIAARAATTVCACASPSGSSCLSRAGLTSGTILSMRRSLTDSIPTDATLRGGRAGRPAAQLGHVVGRGAGLLRRRRDLGQVPRRGQPALVAGEHVHPRGHVTVEGGHAQVQLPVGAGRYAFDLVELLGVTGMHIVERHEHAVTRGLDDRGDGALPPQLVLPGEGQPPAL